jgi:hypothetical protein
VKARLRFYSKNRIQNRYVVELSIHEVGDSIRYPDGIKYGLVCKDLKTDDFVLMDNHHPKGPHFHLNEREFPYQYLSDDQLISDFQRLVLEHIGVTL